MSVTAMAGMAMVVTVIRNGGWLRGSRLRCFCEWDNSAPHVFRYQDCFYSAVEMFRSSFS